MVLPRSPFQPPAGLPPQGIPMPPPGLSGLAPAMAPPVPPLPGMGGPPPSDPMMAMVPPMAPPIAPPPPTNPMGMGGPDPADQILMESMLEDLQAELVEEVKPKYKYGFKPKKIKKPTIEAIAANAREIQQAHEPRLKRHAETLNWLRMIYAGVWERDKEAREQGAQEAFYLSKLVDEMDAMIAVISGIDIAWNKECTHPNDKQDTQKIEDFTYFLRKKEESYWHMRGQRPLKIDEAYHLLTYGFLVSRRVVDIEDTDCPFNYELLDPATVFWVPGGKRGLKAVYHVYTDTLENVLGEFTSDGEAPARLKADLDPKKIQRFGDSALVEVVEYWDEWYRSVTVDGLELMPVTAHELGEVPFVFGFGPSGEPHNTRYPQSTPGGLAPAGTTYGEELSYKSVSYIEYKKRIHAQEEAYAARMLAGFLKSQNPPVIYERSANAQDSEMTDIDGNEGGITETILGEEKISGFPTSPPGVETQALAAMMAENSATAYLPKGMFGENSQSNVSGTAMSNYLQAGWEKVAPWVRAMEDYHSACATLDIRSWRNFGHLARYTEDEPQPFFVPSRNPQSYDAQSFELTPELVDKVGPDIRCRLVRSRRSEWVQLANAAVIMHEQLGIADKEFIAEEIFGFTDAQRKIEKTRGDKMLEAIMTDPEFGKQIVAPQILLNYINEAQGNPELMAYRVEQYKGWVQKNSMAMAQPPAMGPGGPPQGPGGPPAPIGGIPGGTNTAAAMGQGPGSVSGQMGGPQGPQLQGNPMGGI